MENQSSIEKDTEELVDALEWIVEQYEKTLSGEVASNVVESLSYAKSLLKKHNKQKQ